MKKLIICFFTLFINVCIAKANSYYINDNNVSMSFEEQKYINEIYGENYSNYISQEEYDTLAEYNLFNKPIEKKK